VNASHLMPHELLQDIEKGDSMANLQFLSVISKTKTPAGFSIIPVVDVSGSMSGQPMEAAIALALILAHSQPAGSPFSRMFLTFDSEPRMYRVPPAFGEGAVDLAKVIASIRMKPSGLSTDFSKSMDMILSEMVRRQKEEDPHVDAELARGPAKPMIIVFTDMQFDSADEGDEYETNLDVMENKYAAAGVPMPLIVFWNLRGARAAAAQASRKNVVMLSGFSTDLMDDFFDMLSSGTFRDVHAPCQSRDGDEDSGDVPELSTESVVRTALQSDMYRRYKMPPPLLA